MNNRSFITTILAVEGALSLTMGLAQAQGTASIAGQAAQPYGVAGVQAALGTAFTYQGQLKKSGGLVNGLCDMQFSLWNAETGGTQIGLTQSKPNVSVNNGLFTVQLDFGTGAIQGDARWLEMAVRCPAGGGTYATLAPRQQLTPAPYALALPGMWTQQNPTSPNVIGGYSANSVGAGVVGATIGGGGYAAAINSVTGDYGTVGGGSGNVASDTGATVGGGSNNTASGWNATVAGGGGNLAGNTNATVGGGYGNTATGGDATIAGGRENAAGYRAFVGGGEGNNASGQAAAIAGGQQNNASGWAAAIAGGRQNTAQGYVSTVSGGGNNLAQGDGAVVGGGMNNAIRASNSVIGGGTYNVVHKNMAVIGGGERNLITDTADYAVIGGGYNISVTAPYATVGGGRDHIAAGQYSAIGGGNANVASDTGATVGGGSNNTASGWNATVAGGGGNLAGNTNATVGGGYGNAATGGDATIAGGRENAAGYRAFVGGGMNNVAGGYAATVSGGGFNMANAANATVSGGTANTAAGNLATIPGGAGARADLHGQMAYASGTFSVTGDAQTSLYVLRRLATGITWTELFLDGNSQRLTLAAGRTMVFEALIVGRSNNMKSAGYRVTGVIERVFDTTGMVGSAVKTVLGEDDPGWDVNVFADNTNDALRIEVLSGGDTTQWVAMVRTVETQW